METLVGDPGLGIVKIVVVYDKAPAAADLDRHIGLADQIPRATFSYRRVMGDPTRDDEPEAYGEFQFTTMESFQQAIKTKEYLEFRRHAGDLGIDARVNYVELQTSRGVRPLTRLAPPGRSRVQESTLRER